MEVARAHMARDPMLEPDLRPVAQCLALLALPVSQFWKEVLLPPHLTRFPVGPQAHLLDLVAARSLAYGSEDDRKRAVAGRLKEALVHFPALEEVPIDGGS